MIDRYRRYWMGKKPSVRLATEDYLRHPDQELHIVASRHNVSFTAVSNNVKLLRVMNRNGVIDLEEELKK